MANEKNLHEGHRGRLKNRFLNNGLESFEDHNILEMLLFYSIPRKDTNDIAHELIHHFGSLKAVFDADFDELIKFKGISENSATLIKMIPAISRAYLTNKSNKKPVLDNVSAIKEFLFHTYFGETKEVVYLILLNNKFELISLERIHEGSVNSAQIELRKLVDLIVKKNASSIILAHNHPDGFPSPSYEDIQTTADLISTLNLIDIQLIEHFVVTENACTPIIHNTPHLREECPANLLIYKKPY